MPTCDRPGKTAEAVQNFSHCMGPEVLEPGAINEETRQTGRRFPAGSAAATCHSLRSAFPSVSRLVSRLDLLQQLPCPADGAVPNLCSEPHQILVAGCLAYDASAALVKELRW